jgi:transposase InsO family protein
MIAARFVWLGMKADIAAWCRECEACQRAKVTKQPQAPLQPIHIPSRRFSHVHVDLVGPLPASEDGLLYLFTVIDRTTRWLEATPLKETSAASCISAFLSSWVARFGVPERVTTDRGAQFSSATWASFCRQAGLRHVMTTAYHPQANGLVERALASSRLLSGLVELGWIGRLTCPGYFLASMQLPRRSVGSLPRRLFTVSS